MSDSNLGRLSDLPRENLGSWPTPLDRLDRLSAALGIDLWLKRDDLTSLALGGNKVRKLEFLMGDARAQGADIIVTTGGTQSNHARLTAAACCRLGIDCYLVLDRGRHPHNGNILLDELFGAEVEVIEDPNPDVAAARLDVVANELTRRGRHVYVIPRGGSIPQGAVGYMNMIVELSAQLAERGLAPHHLYVATGSCGTHSGIMAGHAAISADYAVQGISVSRAQSQQEAKVLKLSNSVLDWCQLKTRVKQADIHVDDRYAGDAYGVPTVAAWEAIDLFAKTEGIVLDPVYTGKAASGLLDHVRNGLVQKGMTVVFVHTGGAPALFGYAAEVPGIKNYTDRLVGSPG